MHSQPMMHTHSSIERFVQLYNFIGQYDQITCTAKSHCCKQLLYKPHLPWLYHLQVWLFRPIGAHQCSALTNMQKIYAVIHTNGCANIICMYTYTTHTNASPLLMFLLLHNSRSSAWKGSSLASLYMQSAIHAVIAVASGIVRTADSQCYSEVSYSCSQTSGFGNSSDGSLSQWV